MAWTLTLRQHFVCVILVIHHSLYDDLHEVVTIGFYAINVISRKYITLLIIQYTHILSYNHASAACGDSSQMKLAVNCCLVFLS